MRNDTLTLALKCMLAYAAVGLLLSGCGGGGSSSVSSIARTDHPSRTSGAICASSDLGGVSNSSSDTVGAITLLAGSPLGLSGNSDGAGAAAQFNAPCGLAADAAGNVYVADTANDTIRKITPAGVVATLAGVAGVAGSADGAGAAARFSKPTAVALDGAGNVYVADNGNSTIRKITPDGVVSTLAGTAGASGGGDGTGAAARFNGPNGVAVDAAGTVYVSDSGNNTIRKITPAGVVTTLAGNPDQNLVCLTTPEPSCHADGAGVAALFYAPAGLVVDSAGYVYVADSGNTSIRKITPAGVVTTLAGGWAPVPCIPNQCSDGPAGVAQFSDPTGIALDAAGNLYVTDSGTDTVRKITPAGVVSTIAGQAGKRGVALGPLPGLLNIPEGVAVLPSNSGVKLLVTNTAGNNLVSIMTGQ